MALTFNQKKLVVGSFIIVAAVCYLIYAGIRDTMVYFLTVNEVLVKGQMLNDKGIRVGGKVAQGSVSRDMENLNLRFEMEDEKTNEKLAIEYHGIVPDTFKEGAIVVVEGKISADKVFHARALLAKCPSKYEARKSQ